MIQRIQSLYLLVIVILSGFTLLLPVVDFVNAAEGLHYLLGFKGIYLVQETGSIFESSTWALSAIATLVPIISFISIFLYKNRINQIRLSVINMFLMIGYYILLLIFVWFASVRLNADWSLRFVIAFPLINLILNYLAMGAIGKDEKLVKSLNRIR